MAAIGAKGQGLDFRDGGQIERVIEMREQRAAARGLPFQACAERLGFEAHQQQVVLSGKMLRGCLLRLRGGGEMDIAVGEIDRRTAEDAGALGLTPEGRGDDLVDGGHECPRCYGGRLIHGCTPPRKRRTQYSAVYREAPVYWGSRASALARDDNGDSNHR